jgi:hypothetical protein
LGEEEALTGAEKFLLRSVAIGEDLASTKRLASIDALAAADNVYCTRHFSCETYVLTPKRSTKFIIGALRKLAKTKMAISGATKSGIAERLFFIKTNRALVDSCGRKWLYRVEPDASHPAQPEQISPVAQGIEEFLASQKEGNNADHRPAETDCH